MQPSTESPFDGADKVREDRRMLQQVNDDQSLVKGSLVYQEFLREREEILRHKWIESEKAGRDIGFEKALLGWVINHRAAWRAATSEPD
jgi:hypothetical protein